LKADFGGTEIYSPLAAIFGEPLIGTGVRQLFVITDGEVSNTDRVLELCRRNSSSNRCFAIALGSGADAGLVQGIADVTGGRADFVSGSDDLTGKVIGQLEVSLRGVLANVSIEFAGVGGIEFAPFPVPAISAAIAQTIFGRSQIPLSQSRVLISGTFLGEQIDEVVESHEAAVNEEVLKALFAYETIKKSEGRLREDRALRAKIIQLSIESGVLCGETAFVGFSNEVFRIRPRYDVSDRFRGRDRCGCGYCPAAAAPSCAPPPMACCAGTPPSFAASPRSCAPPPMACSAAAPSFAASPRSCAAPSMACYAVDQSPMGACLSDDDDAVPVKPSDPMLALIGLQKVQGSWNNIQAIQQVCGIHVECPSELTGKVDVFATVLAIAVLRKRFSDRESQWKMIERKGLRWLNSQGIDSERIITELISLC
jgi:hypothetical protein